jgi:hypothetical protein
VAQGVGPEFNPQYCKKKKREKGRFSGPGPTLEVLGAIIVVILVILIVSVLHGWWFLVDFIIPPVDGM